MLTTNDVGREWRSRVAEVNIGLRLAQYGVAWDTLREHALLAERRGFHALWANDHLRTPGRLTRLDAFDAITVLAALAPLTHRARLGIAVLSSSYRPAPLAAKMTTGLDVISAGRLTIGLGTGSDAAEHAMYGIEFGSGPERAELLEEAFAVIRGMQINPAGADVGLLEGALNLPPPVQSPPPIWIAANKRRLLRFAGANAEGIFTAFTDPAGVKRRLAVAREAAEASGRPTPACALYTYALPIDSRADAHAWVRAEADALGVGPDRFIRWLTTTGVVDTAAGLRERIAAFAAAGVTDVILVLPNRVPAEAIDALADGVLA